MWPKTQALPSSTFAKNTFEHSLLKQYREQERPPLEQHSREIRELVTCIHGKLFEPGLNVKMVRELCRIRDNNISSRFRRAMGQGIKAYIDNHRMAAAGILLLNTDLSIFDVAMEVGYSHVETFYQVFHRQYGCTPGVYREGSVSELKTAQ